MKITFVGAGSTVFVKNIIGDCMLAEPLREATFALYDINEERLGESQAMQEVFRTIGRLSRSDISVLITGETGSGKEVVARVLHQHSPRADKPSVANNTAAIPNRKFTIRNLPSPYPRAITRNRAKTGLSANAVPTLIGFRRQKYHFQHRDN